MKTKIVYIVTLRDGGLRFFEMFQLSVESLRLHQPDARIELIIDNVSYASLCETGQAVPKGVKLINVDVPQEWERQKSRYLKTKLRTLTGGDYLYLDVDTLISGNLEKLDYTDADLAAVPDGNGPAGLWNESEAELCVRAGIPSPMGKPYFNSGVMFVRDIQSSYVFYEQWHMLWKAMAGKGIGRDQMALLEANERLGRPVRELAAEWNCQICCSAAIHYFRNARIIHYYSDISCFPDRFVTPHFINGCPDNTALALAADPIKSGFRFYYTKHRRFSRFVSEFLYIFRNNQRIFRYIKSLPGKVERLMK